jgi:hypothetical protein
MKFRDIPQFPRANYRVTVSWKYLEEKINDFCTEKLAPLNLEPDFQRGHVWTEEQQVKYVEYALRGGESGLELYFNCPGWMDDYRGPFEIVDGKQRLQAARQFLNNKIKAFGYFYKEFEGSLSTLDVVFYFNIANLKSRKEVLQWYLDFNSGGTVHSQEELDRVKALLEKEK